MRQSPPRRRDGADRPVGDAYPQPRPRRCLAGRPQHGQRQRRVVARRHPLHDGVAPRQRRGRTQRRQPRGEVRDVRGAPVQAALDARPRGVAQPLDLRRAAPPGRAADRPAPGGAAAPRAAAPRGPPTRPAPAGPGRAARPPARSPPARSGTRRRPASVGVEQRRSATWSTSGVSGSCPMAETTGVRHAATARHSVSSENGSRSSTLPPPRARTMTSTSGSRSSTPIASTICGTASAPCVAVCSSRKRTAGQRAVALVTTSCSAADARPVIKPDAAGQERQAALAGGVEEPLGGQQRAQPLDAGQQLADPDRADRVDAQAQRAAAEEERRLAVHHHPVALGDRRAAVADQPDRGGELQRHVGGGVAQDEERGARARPRGDLRELALDPDRARAGPPTRRSCGRRCGRARATPRSSARALLTATHPSVTAAIRLLSMVTYGGRSPCACSQASSARRSSTPRWRSLPRSWGMVSEP